MYLFPDFSGKLRIFYRNKIIILKRYFTDKPVYSKKKQKKKL